MNDLSGVVDSINLASYGIQAYCDAYLSLGLSSEVHSELQKESQEPGVEAKACIVLAYSIAKIKLQSCLSF